MDVATVRSPFLAPTSLSKIFSVFFGIKRQTTEAAFSAGFVQFAELFFGLDLHFPSDSRVYGLKMGELVDRSRGKILIFVTFSRQPVGGPPSLCVAQCSTDREDPERTK